MSLIFRSDESARNSFESAKRYLIKPHFSSEDSYKSLDKLHDIVDQYGPSIDGYPSWHPLVTNHDDRYPVTWPNNDSGYKGLDHTICFRNAFLTCPYNDGQKIIDSVSELQGKLGTKSAVLHVERLDDVKFYMEDANPLLVSCEWLKPLQSDGLIPASIALPLMLQKEIPCWEFSERGETWETMRPYFLGQPHGNRSSLFVNQETAITMKKVWNLIINTGMFGPINVSNQ